MTDSSVHKRQLLLLAILAACASNTPSADSDGAVDALPGSDTLNVAPDTTGTPPTPADASIDSATSPADAAKDSTTSPADTAKDSATSPADTAKDSAAPLDTDTSAPKDSAPGYDVAFDTGPVTPCGLSLGGTLTQSCRLVANTTYYLSKDLIIDGGGALIVEPGVTVIARRPTLQNGDDSVYGISVRYGHISAVGTANAPITFTAERPFVARDYRPTIEGIYLRNDDGAGWGGFVFENVDGRSTASVFEHVVFEYAKKAYSQKANPVNGRMWTRGGALHLYGYGRVRVSNSLFRNNWAIYCGAIELMAVDNQEFDIANNVFEDNAASDNGGTICVTHGMGGSAMASIKNNVFRRSSAISNNGNYFSQRDNSCSNFFLAEKGNTFDVTYTAGSNTICTGVYESGAY